MRNSQKRILQEHLESKVLSKIVLIQRWVRAKLHRCRFLHIRRSAIILQVSFSEPLSLSSPLPWLHRPYPEAGWLVGSSVLYNVDYQQLSSFSPFGGLT